MFVFAEVKLKLEKDVKRCLMDIYGIGYFKANFLIAKVGLSKLLKMKFLSEFHFNIMIILIKSFFLTDVQLRQRKARNVKILVDSEAYRGVRLLMKLPQCNQRTKRNAKTAKKRKSENF